MPNIKSAKKRVKVIDKKTLRNQMIKSAIKTSVKKFDLSLNDKETATAAYRTAVKKIDQAVAKGVMHKNTAARKKSSMTMKLNAVG